MQCLRRYRDSGDIRPHLVNAGKYLSSFPVIITSLIVASLDEGDADAPPGAYAAWILAALVNMLYTLWWDIRMDWGLFDGSGVGWGLRKRILFPVWAYRFAIAWDAVGESAPSERRRGETSADCACRPRCMDHHPVSPHILEQSWPVDARHCGRG